MAECGACKTFAVVIDAFTGLAVEAMTHGNASYERTKAVRTATRRLWATHRRICHRGAAKANTACQYEYGDICGRLTKDGAQFCAKHESEVPCG